MRLAAALALLASGAAAQDCRAPQTQFDLNACAGMAYAAADEELNRVWRAVTARLTDLPDTRAALVAAQRAWIAFRDADCAFVASGVAGGSAQPMVAALCLTERTAQRTAELQAHLDCPEGDLACPVP